MEVDLPRSVLFSLSLFVASHSLSLSLSLVGSICPVDALLKAKDYILVTSMDCNVTADSRRWLQLYGARRKTVHQRALQQDLEDENTSDVDPPADPPLRSCQRACLEACAGGARVVEMACGTGKTRIMRELAQNTSGKVLS